MKVTVCVITYNHENYIEDCLRSIVLQETSFPFEVLVADDCSTDKTREIVRRYSSLYPNIVFPILREENIGGTQNYVQVHNEARGEYVCHCDGDDIWLPGKLQAQVDFLDRNPSFSLVWTRVNFFNNENGFYPGKDYDYSMFPDGVVTLEDALVLGAVAVHSTMMYRSNVRKTRNVDFEVLDIYYVWEYLTKGKGKILSEVLAEYRVGVSGGATSTKGRIKKMYAHHAYVFLHKFPEYRKNIFMFSILNFLADLKNRRGSTLDFFKLMLTSRTYVPIKELYLYYKIFQKLKIPLVRKVKKTKEDV